MDMSVALNIVNRPFATENISGLMTPDGIFVDVLGSQGINAQFLNPGSTPSAGAQVYLESVDDPKIVVTPNTYSVPALPSNATKLLTWQADFSNATPGKHYVSFMVVQGAQSSRIIARIFVMSVGFAQATKTFTAIVPEGQMNVQFIDLVGSTAPCGCNCGGSGGSGGSGGGTGSGGSGCDCDSHSVMTRVAKAFSLTSTGNFNPCLGGFLPHHVIVVVAPNPPFPGQYGDVPFQDPWWKIVLCIVALILAAASAIVEGVSGSSLTVSNSTSSDGGSPGTPNCCGFQFSEGGGPNKVAAALAAAAAACATVAACSDARDPFRRGEDNTIPASGALTTAEHLKLKITYLETMQMGKPFAIGANWTYTRETTAGSLTYSVNETQNNVHVIDHYDITAPNVVRTYQREAFIVQAKFTGPGNVLFVGAELFVQCFLIGPTGQLYKFLLEDNGAGGHFGDATANDGIYTGGWQFLPDDKGIWTFIVIAQDVNDATPSMTAEQAAQIIGGMVLTHQLSITFQGGTCPLVPDGHVHVV
jgi:hypothetical protein